MHVNLHKGDCIQIMDDLIEQSIKVDLILTDPPYKTITGGSNNSKNSRRPTGILTGNHGFFKYPIPKIHEWMPRLYELLENDSHCYIFTNALNLRDMLNSAHEAGFKIHNVLVWVKNNCTPSQYYMKNCEYILFLRKGRAKWINNIGSSKTAHNFNNVIGNKKHPCEKPNDLLEMYIRNSSKQGDIVFDPFMGCGSAGIAAVKNNRRFIGIEIDELYFNIASNSIENFLSVNENVLPY